MKNNWQTKKIGDFLTLEYGKPLDKSLRKQSGKYPAYGANGVKAWSDEFYYDKKTIIIGRKGSAGETTLTEDKFWPLDVTYFVKFDESKYDLYFLYHMLSCLDLPSLATGVKPGINRNNVYSIEVNIPPLSEQKHIVAILDQAFADIEKIRANTEKNLKNVRELFESYLQEVFSQRGGRRNKWAEYTLGEVCNFFNGQAHEQHVSENGQYVLINSKFISSNGQSKKRTDKALAPLFSGDVVFVMSDVPKGKALAKCFLVDTDNTYTLNQRICVIRSDKYHKKFLYYHLNRHKYLLGFDNGENQTNLRKNDILNCPLYLPPISEQQHIVDKLDLLNAQIKELEKFYTKKRNSLIELKKSLLHQAFSGQLTKQEVAT